MKFRDLRLGGIMFAGVIIIVSFVYAVNIQPVVIGDTGWISSYAELNNFNSYEELAEFLSKNCLHNSGYGCQYESRAIPGMVNSISVPDRISIDSVKSTDTIDYSKTNIQVQGVDEPDVVKTDGIYIYILAKSRIYIIKAYPTEEAKVLSIISFESDIHISNFFINKDRLIVFGTSYRYPIEYDLNKIDVEYCYYWWGVSTTVINIYDISVKENPEIVKDIQIDGSYFNARMIGDYIYVITTDYSGNIYRVIDDNVIIIIPEITVNDVTSKLPADQIYYINSSEKKDTITHVITINIFDNEIDQKSFFIGSSQKMYVSKNNIYLACVKYSYEPLFWNSYEYRESVVIHKISINNGDISYETKGEVPGRILNQFSMDEYNGFFRIVTTVYVWDSEMKSSNSIYILDTDLEHVSKIESIAPGERIYSARFIGKKAYLVTFKKVDPFFTIDLSDPYNPKILGELKIPGYSDYLHPFDDNHIIGIGKDTVESYSSNFAWYQGLKIALFDVSDFNNPREVSKVIIGDRGTDSPVLYNHRAFLFDREKELLVIPLSLYEISDEIKEQHDGYTANICDKFTFQGAYVYKLSIENGFEYRGRVTHMDEDEFQENEQYWYRWSSSSYIHRSLYIGDILFTISDKMIKINNLEDLNEIKSVELV